MVWMPPRGRIAIFAAGIVLGAVLLGPGMAVGQQADPAPPSDEGEEKRQVFPGIDLDLVARRITIKGAISIPRGLLELVACTPYGKTHESICSLDVNPQHFKAALILLGLEETPQVAKLGEGKALEGDRVYIFIEWESEGETKRYRAEELIWNRRTDAPMKKVGWTFTGSRFLKVPIYTLDKEDPEEREVFMASETGTLVTTYHDPDSILDNPLAMGGDDTIWYANDKLLPPRWTPVRFIVEPAKKAPIGDETETDRPKEDSESEKRDRDARQGDAAGGKEEGE